ncbi:hypothetical protein TB1_021659 [Malus domestica]
MLAVYASTDEKRRRAQWRELSMRVCSSQGKCIVIGDFNDIVDDEENEGGNYRSMASIRDFRELLADNELLDLGFEGFPFTWRNKCDDGLIQQWIDRSVATAGWMEMFPRVKTNHVVLERSDHYVLVFSSDKTIIKRPHQFIYDSRWGKNPDCRDIIMEVWKESVKGSSAFRVSEKLKVRQEHIKEKENELTWAIKKEEYYWKVKSRNTWLREGDKNTKFFHAQTNIAITYFMDLFHAGDSRQNGEVTTSVESKVSDLENEELIHPFLDEEIREAMFQIPATKSPGRLLQKTNHTNIVLILKVKARRRMAKLRPIPLCNVVYKIIAKMAIKLDMAKAYNRGISDLNGGYNKGTHCHPLYFCYVRKLCRRISKSLKWRD